MSGYSPFDQDEKLGPSPWSSKDPRLIAWEIAHGHDVRLKCYAEFGCLVLSAAQDELQDAAQALLDVRDAWPALRYERQWERLRAVLKALEAR